MMKTTREDKFLKEITNSLESDDSQVLKNALIKLIDSYQKQLRRIEKVLVQSDKQQDRLLKLNEKLEITKIEQSKNISSLIDAKRTNAKNIIENKKKIFEIHKQELMRSKANIDELTQMIIQKDEALTKLQAYVNENQRLRQEINRLEQSSHIEKVKDTSLSKEHLKDILNSLSARFNLEFDILQVVNNLLAGELNFGKISIEFFSQNGLRLIQKGIHTLLNSYDKSLPNAKLSDYILHTYLYDILSVCADRLVNLVGSKNTKAAVFINFFDGEVTIISDGSRVQKPEIRSSNGIKWNANSIYQVAFQYQNLMQKINEKEEIINNIKIATTKNTQELNELDSNLMQLRTKDDDMTKSIKLLQVKLDFAEKELINANNISREAIEDNIQKLQGSLRTLRLHANSRQNADINVVKEIDYLESKQSQLNDELSSLKQLHEIETKRYNTLKEIFEPLETKYNLAVSALAKAIYQFELQNIENK